MRCGPNGNKRFILAVNKAQIKLIKDSWALKKKVTSEKIFVLIWVPKNIYMTDDIMLLSISI